MSTVVYQNYQPCFESNMVESRTLSLKLHTPQLLINPSQTSNSCTENVSSKSDNGLANAYSYSNILGWNGIDAQKASEKEQPVYVHPMVKRSKSALSQKSLEMCTESLGCETGTCIMESSIFFSSTMTNAVKSPRAKSDVRSKEVKKAELPPPLTTIRGSNAIHVQQFREDGRLVIKAVATAPASSCLQAERSDGRLRLSFTKDYTPEIVGLDECASDNKEDNDNHDCETINTEKISTSSEQECCVRSEDHCKTMNTGKNSSSSEQECCVRSEEDEETCTESGEKQEPEGNECDAENVNVSDIKLELGVRRGFGQIQRLGRCKERGQGNKRSINWEPFWVVT